jgi:cytochrome P450
MNEGTLSVDLLAPDVNDDPYPHFAALREQDPVHWSDRHRGWIITRYNDCSAALMDYKRLSSDRVRPLLEAMPAERRAQVGPVYELMTGWMVVSDPPDHRRLRALAANAFNPKRVQAMEAEIQRLVDQTIDEFIASGEQDLIAGFSYPLPATVIAKLIGAREEDTWRFRDWSLALAHVAFGAGGDDRSDRHTTAMQGLEQMIEYFGELLEYRRAHPGEDMISDLLQDHPRWGRLDEDEIKAMCALMLFAGHETTTSTIASAVLTLIRHPDQLALLQSDPDGLAGGAAEESLRYEGAIKILHRWTVEDLEIRGREIKAGDRVYVAPASANRDPEKFEDPDRFDITRSPNAHIAFGKGIHACIGAQLARLEMRLALASMVKRLPGLRLADPDAELSWVPSLASRGLSELRIAHDARA